MRNRVRTFSAALALLPSVVNAVPQSKSMGLSAEFSTAALDAARVVDSDEGMSKAAAGEADAAVETAGAAAHTQGDSDALKALRAFLDDKLDNNVLRAQVVAKAVDAWKNAHPQMVSTAAAAEELAGVRMQALDHPGVREMTRREDDCASDLGRMLRSGSFRTTERCAAVRMSRDEHAMAQFFPAAAVSR